MKWKKLGKLLEINNNTSKMKTHARIPILDFIDEESAYIYFGSRDLTNRERIFRAKFNLNKLKILDIDAKPILEYGEILGSFDDNGVSPCCIVNFENGIKYFYYAGWNIHVKIPFTCAIGLMESIDGGKTFKKKFNGPILDRNKYDFQFVAVNDVMYDNGVFKTWYLSAIKWEKDEKGNLKHFYNIKFAESKNGIDWKVNDRIAIDFKNEYEYAISTPRVIKESENNYKMWYSYRAQKDIDTYRIGYAESKDGINWIRKDDKIGIDVSKEGWDSEMICYPYVFDHKGKRYMLYNGNGYGKTGFGIAVLEQD